MSVSTDYLSQFSAPDGYLDFAAVGPPSQAAAEALMDAFKWVASPTGPAGVPLHEGVLRARQAVATMVGTTVDQVGLTHSTSEGLFSAAFGLGEGGNVVVPAGEFPANLYPWIRAAQRNGPEVRFVENPDGRTTAEVLAPFVDGETKAISVSLVDFLTGFRVNVEELRALAGDRLLVVDGIQGVGAVDASLAPCDVLVGGGQKWLRAGNGVGFVAMSERALERLDTSLVGWTGVEDYLTTEIPAPHPASAGAIRYQIGSAPLIMAAPMTAAVDLVLSEGADVIESTILSRAQALEDVARRHGAEVIVAWNSDSERAGIVTFKLDPPADVVAKALDSAGITVSVRGGEWIRMSPHATTPVEVAGRLDEVLQSLKV
ncbi:MAG: aminotransferase class V-fold PLP-dependent enzyme [Acidimicrobiia bacterium]